MYTAILLKRLVASCIILAILAFACISAIGAAEPHKFSSSGIAVSASSDISNSTDIIQQIRETIDRLSSSIMGILAGDSSSISQSSSSNIIKVYIKNNEIIAADGDGDGSVIARANTPIDAVRVIQEAINYTGGEGGKILLKGDFSVPAPRYLSLERQNNIILEGDEEQVLLKNIGISIKNCENITLRNIDFSGGPYYGVYVAGGVRALLLENCNARNMSAETLAAFFLQVENDIIENVKFENCHVTDSGCFGFLNDGSGSPNIIKNITYLNCSAVGCGNDSRHLEWVTGFDIAEKCNVENIYLINCTADRNWESGFHLEGDPDKFNVNLINCTSSNNGRIKSNPTFGAGFLITSGMNLSNCRSSNNFIGYSIYNNKLSTISLSNCTDVKSNNSLTLSGDSGMAVIDGFTSSYSQMESIILQDCSHIFGKRIQLLQPNGNPIRKHCSSLLRVRDSQLDISSKGDNQEILLFSQECSNTTLRGNLETRALYPLNIVFGKDILVDSMGIDSNGMAGISIFSGKIAITNTTIMNTMDGTLEYGILADGTSDVSIDESSVTVSGNVSTPFKVGISSAMEQMLGAGDWFDRGNTLYDQGDFQGANESYTKATTLDPNHAAAWSGKGNALYNLANYNGSLIAYDKAINLDQNLVLAWTIKGIVLRDLGMYSESLECLDKAIQIDPSLAFVWYAKGWALATIGEYQDAIAAYKRAIEIDQRLSPAWSGQGDALFCLGRYQEAIDMQDEAIELDSKNPDAWLGKGLALSKLGKAQESMEHFRKTIEITSDMIEKNPKYTHTWLINGDALLELGRYEDSIKSYSKALELNPREADAWTGRGDALARLGRYDESISSYDKAIEINPQLAKAWHGSRHLR